MRFDVITLFPELFEPFLRLGVTRRAFSQGQVSVRLWDLREHGEGPHQRVDDRPFGGGPGMVLMAPPLARCLDAVRGDRLDPADARVPVVLFSPAGPPLRHPTVMRWAGSAGAILVCGRYEGVDQRFVEQSVDELLSLGDFVLSGGEIAALALLDAVARLQPGVLGDEQSSVQESFTPALDGLLDCPQYTRPEIWLGQAAPAVLLSGNHARIARWRREQQLLQTACRRPDLLGQARAAGRLDEQDEALLARHAETL